MIGDELGPSSRALLDAARGSLGPDADAIRRMRTKIAATVAGTAATVAAASHASAATTPATAATTAPTATATASAASGFALKLSIVGVIALASLGALALRDRAPSLDRPHLTPATRVDQRDHASTARDALAPAPAPSTRPASRAPSRPSSTRAPSANPAPAATSSSPAAVPSAPSAPATLAREVDLLDTAMAALRDGDPRGALSAVRTHARETAGRGQLTEDAAAIEIEALCALSDPLAPVRLDEFDARFPTSVQRARLSAACK